MSYTISVGRDFAPMTLDWIEYEDLRVGDYVTPYGVSVWRIDRIDTYVAWKSLHTTIVASDRSDRIGEPFTFTVHDASTLRYWRESA